MPTLNTTEKKTYEDIHILVVDDHFGDAEHTQNVLVDCKISNALDVVHLTDGEQAMSYIHKAGEYKDGRHPDLILLDLNMPNKCGREVLQELEQDQVLKKLPVIVLTDSQVDKDDLRLLDDSHAHCHIPKPIKLGEFVSAIREISGFSITVVK